MSLKKPIMIVLCLTLLSSTGAHAAKKVGKSDFVDWTRIQLESNETIDELKKLDDELAVERNQKKFSNAELSEKEKKVNYLTGRYFAQAANDVEMIRSLWATLAFQNPLSKSALRASKENLEGLAKNYNQKLDLIATFGRAGQSDLDRLDKNYKSIEEIGGIKVDDEGKWVERLRTGYRNKLKKSLQYRSVFFVLGCLSSAVCAASDLAGDFSRIAIYGTTLGLGTINLLNYIQWRLAQKNYYFNPAVLVETDSFWNGVISVVPKLAGQTKEAHERRKQWLKDIMNQNRCETELTQ